MCVFFFKNLFCLTSGCHFSYERMSSFCFFEHDWYIVTSSAERKKPVHSNCWFRDLWPWLLRRILFTISDLWNLSRTVPHNIQAYLCLTFCQLFYPSPLWLKITVPLWAWLLHLMFNLLHSKQVRSGRDWGRKFWCRHLSHSMPRMYVEWVGRGNSRWCGWAHPRRGRYGSMGEFSRDFAEYKRCWKHADT